jgi:hypothetical protein
MKIIVRDTYILATNMKIMHYSSYGDSVSMPEVIHSTARFRTDLSLKYPGMGKLLCTEATKYIHSQVMKKATVSE